MNTSCFSQIPKNGIRVPIYVKFFVVFSLFPVVSCLAEEVEQDKVGKYLGAASCAASTCHGGVLERGAAWRYSWTQWSASDPHVNAGLSLQSQLSRNILMRLLGKSDETVTQQDLNALLRNRCISCHVTTTPQQCNSVAPLNTDFLVTGVSCESCHGASGGWLKTHCSVEFTEQQRRNSGFRETKGFQQQANGCVRCHIGSRTADGLVRDMNHDMIAAGHPVLRFDMESYRRALPPHWEAVPESQQSPVRDRSIGRSVALSAAAALASERARAFLDGTSAPFPEFADYDCFGCHQALSIEDYTISAGQGRGLQRASNGFPIWNAWYVDNLVQMNQADWRMLPANAENATRLSEAAAQLAVLFRAEAVDQAGRKFDAEKVLAEAQERCRATLDWHEAAVLFLDVDAALRDLALRDATLTRTREKLISDVGVFLRFPAGSQSPGVFDRKTQESFKERLSGILQRFVERETDSSDKDVLSEKNLQVTR